MKKVNPLYGNKYTGFEVAVIGMDGRFSGVRHIEEFWENLISARDTIFHLSDEAKKRVDAVIDGRMGMKSQWLLAAKKGGK